MAPMQVRDAFYAGKHRPVRKTFGGIDRRKDPRERLGAQPAARVFHGE